MSKQDWVNGEAGLELDGLSFTYQLGVLDAYPLDDDFDSDEQRVKGLLPQLLWYRDNGGTGLMTTDLDIDDEALAEQIYDQLVSAGAKVGPAIAI